MKFILIVYTLYFSSSFIGTTPTRVEKDRSVFSTMEECRSAGIAEQRAADETSKALLSNLAFPYSRIQTRSYCYDPSTPSLILIEGN